ncbi:hypothetical protein F2P79_023154 [Pimephales promelas]|nr:hypothetical protein F2P79_023154 [Pimephales promelas]
MGQCSSAPLGLGTIPGSSRAEPQGAVPTMVCEAQEDRARVWKVVGRGLTHPVKAHSLPLKAEARHRLRDREQLASSADPGSKRAKRSWRANWRAVASLKRLRDPLSTALFRAHQCCMILSQVGNAHNMAFPVAESGSARGICEITQFF